MLNKSINKKSCENYLFKDCYLKSTLFGRTCQKLITGRNLQEQGKRALTANKNYRYGPSLKRRWLKNKKN
jgi:hypothetical protein